MLARVTDGEQTEWFGHPRGLTILFLTEMWEKFSFFGMRALLVYYMVKHLEFPQAHASLIYGSYAAFVYLTPLAGGFISDKWLGARTSVLIGGAVMALGHFLLAFEGLFFAALCAIVLGNGLFLPNLPSQVRGLYKPGDERATSAYSLYYMGVNLGAFLAPFVCGTLGELYGWHWGFAVAGAGMLAGLAVYGFGWRYLPPDKNSQRGDAAGHAASQERTTAGSSGAWNIPVWTLAGAAIAVILFRGGYEQIGNTVALWADSHVDRGLGAQTIPMTWFQAVNPLLVLLLTPVVVVAWAKWESRKEQTSHVGRMSFGALTVALAYLILAVIAQLAAATGGQPHWSWLIMFFFILTLGELNILPIGLAFFGKSAPAGYGATVMASWFLAAFAGNLLAGVVGVLWSQTSPSIFFSAAACLCATSAILLAGLSVGTRRAVLSQAGVHNVNIR